MRRHRKKTRNDFSFWYAEILKVTWEDISGTDEGTVKDVDKPLLFDSYGVCVSETEKALIVCSMMPIDSKDKEFRSLLRIPKRSINQIKIMEVRK